MTGKLTNGVWSAVTETTYREAYEEGYKAGAAAEREECAKIADNNLMDTTALTSLPEKSRAAWKIAAAIRARGQT